MSGFLRSGIWVILFWDFFPQSKGGTEHKISSVTDNVQVRWFSAQKGFMSPLYSPFEDFDLCSCFQPVFVLGVCVSELCNTWFPCCCEIEIFFVQLCEMFKGINSKQTSGFWVFLCPPPCPSSGSRWGMLQGIRNWGTVEWIDLASSNTTAIWGAPWHVPSVTAKYYFSGSFWIVVGFFSILLLRCG